MTTLTEYHSRRTIFAWCLYDWANSAFPSVITTFIFAAYFTQSIATNTIQGTAQWGFANTIAGIIIALTSPILGALADFQGQRKPWLAVFSAGAIIASTMLWWALPSDDYVNFALTWFIIGTVCFEIATVFYNAMLRDLVPSPYYGRVSGWGWGMGYAGGLACLGAAWWLFIGPSPIFTLNINQAEHVRICGPLVAIWFGVFTIPLLWYLPKSPVTNPLRSSLMKGLHQFIHSWKTLRQHPNIFKMLIAHMIYIDGLNTIFTFGGIFAAGTFHFTTQQILLFGVMMNISAGLGALVFAWVDDYIGAKVTILLSLACIVVAGTFVLTTHSPDMFWVFTLILGLFVGPVQASSRSLLANLTPHPIVNEVFGLYAFSGKATAYLGPWVLGLVTLHYGSQRIGMATTLLFLIIGAFALVTVQIKKDVKE